MFDGLWSCSLGIAALSVEALIILLAAGRAWQARHRASRVTPPRYPVERRESGSSLSGLSRSR